MSVLGDRPEISSRAGPELADAGLVQAEADQIEASLSSSFAGPDLSIYSATTGCPAERGFHPRFRLETLGGGFLGEQARATITFGFDVWCRSDRRDHDVAMSDVVLARRNVDARSVRGLCRNSLSSTP